MAHANGAGFRNESRRPATGPGNDGGPARSLREPGHGGRKAGAACWTEASARRDSAATPGLSSSSIFPPMWPSATPAGAGPSTNPCAKGHPLA
jgi:hypothetical protein